MKISAKRGASVVAPLFLGLLLCLLCACSKKASGISGLVVDGGGRPIANVKVMALQEKPVSGYAKLETVTGADGRFSLPACYPESNYKLLLHAEGTDLREMKVRSGAAGTEMSLSSPVVFRFLSSQEGIIIDTKTGLQWALDSVKTATWEQARQHIKELRLGGYVDWRMPDKKELKALGKVDADFPIAECCVWSSAATGGMQAWVVDLYRSVEEVAFMSNSSYAALAVRRPQ